MKQTLEYLLKHKLLIQSIYKITFSTLFRLIGIFIKTDDSLILLNSFGGRTYNDSPKAIFEYMIAHPQFRNYKYIWAFENPEKFHIKHAEKVKINSIQYFITALRAKIWISNANIERGLRFKKRNTIYLNTWHGTGPKTGGNAVEGRKDYDFSYVDIICCDGEASKNHYIKDFNALEKNLLYSGRPREDALYRIAAEQIQTFRQQLEIPKDKKVILYAPTWRESKDAGKSYNFEIPINMDRWRSELQEQYIILLRAHLFTDKILGIEFNDFIRNVSDYPDINHLYAVSELLISDYSSVFSDFAILGKPIICYAYDFDEYVRSRGIYPEYYNKFPGGIVRNEEDVLNRIKNMDYAEECRMTIEFRNKILSRGENATEMCVAELARRVAGKITG